MIPNIISTITKNNQLRIDISNLNLEHGDFKLCFSLVYSIISIDGAEILKQVGRYYELKTKNNSFLLTLQKPRIGTYNLSCGPEGIFMITKNNLPKNPCVSSYGVIGSSYLIFFIGIPCQN